MLHKTKDFFTKKLSDLSHLLCGKWAETAIELWMWFLKLGVVLLTAFAGIIGVIAFVLSLFGLIQGSVEWYIPVLLFVVIWIIVFLHIGARYWMEIY
jgi:phosphoglycerol transferase MdoB-like AlkP superfamily enzyme